MDECLSVEGGFLPPVVPLDVLPGRFATHLAACEELAARYHAPDASVRPWLAQTFARHDPELDAELDLLAPAELDGLMTVLCVLGHAWRWDAAPPRRDRQDVGVLPEGIAAPWARLSVRLGVPRMGSLYSMVLNNWRLPERGGTTYLREELKASALRARYSWLQAPADAELHAFVGAAVETEAMGGQVVRTAVELVRAASHESVQEVGYLLDRIAAEIRDMAHPFARYAREHRLDRAEFLTLIERTTLWDPDAGEGATSAQFGAVQVAEAVLGMGHPADVVRARQGMPARHRRFLETFDAHAAVVRDFVAVTRDRQLGALWHAAGHALRGLRPQHAVVTPRTGVPENPPVDPTGIDRVFRFLTAEDREELLAGARTRTYAQDEPVIEAGARRIGIFVVRSGSVRVERTIEGQAVPIAHLGPGSLFGEMSFLENEDTSAAVIANEDCEIDVIRREYVFGLFARRDGFAARFFQSVATLLSQRLRETSERLGKALSPMSLDDA
ncbi:MAG: cyclic nucleotide-binding domain-containing protein [Myxococcota bacterium]